MTNKGSKDDRIAAMMSTARPLDALLPDLREAYEPLPQTPIHQRVLEVELDGVFEWVIACWHDPGTPEALHEQTRALLEATLLATLSYPPKTGAALDRTYQAVRIFSFDHLAHAPESALRAFGFQRATYQAEQNIARMAALKDEAERVGRTLPLSPTEVWQTPVANASPRLHEQLIDIQQQMYARMGDDVWGETPGGPSKLLARLLEQRFHERITPDLAGLRTMELLLTHRPEGVIRWIPPLLFQALCDFIAVVIHMTWGTDVQWAVCEQDPLGLYPPPSLRVPQPEGPVFVPIGLHVLRWCIMPLQPGEEVPSLADWVSTQFVACQ